MAVAHRQPSTPKSDDDYCWGNTWLPAVLEAIRDAPHVSGGFEGKVYGIRLHAEYGMFATATIMHGCGSEITGILPHFGTNWLSAALGAPRGLQAITVDIHEEKFVIVHCRYAPIDTPIDAVVAALKASEDD